MSEESFGSIAVQHGFVTPDQLKEALKEQQELRARGQDVLLGRILLDRGFLSTSNYLKLLALKDKLIKCPACGTSYNIVGHVSEENISCVECGTKLQVSPEVLEGELVKVIDTRSSAETSGRLVRQAVVNRDSTSSVGPVLLIFALLAAIVIAVLVLYPHHTATTAPQTQKKDPENQKPEESKPATPVIGEAFKKARDFESAHPDDIEGSLELYRQALAEANLPEISHECDLLQQRLDGDIAKQKAATVRDLEMAASSKNYGRAFELIDAVTRKFRATAWKEFVDAVRTQYQTLARNAALDLEQKANSRLAEGKFDEAIAAWRDLEKLGLKEYAERIPKELQEIEQARHDAAELQAKFEARKADEEKTAYSVLWQELIELAFERRYDEAAARARAWAENVTSSELKREAADDAADLKVAKSAVDEALRGLARLKKGDEFSVVFFKPDRKLARLTGKIQAVTEQGVVIGEPAEYIKVAQMGTETILRLGRLGSADDTAIALFCIFERAALPEGIKAKLRAKYIELLKRPVVQQDTTPVQTPDRMATDLFREAEREYLGKDKSSAVAKYERLSKEFQETATVKSNAKKIAERAAFAREVVVSPSDWSKISGKWTIARDTRAPLTKIVMTPERDRDPVGFNPESSNYVETTITVISGVPYRLWIQLGYCCIANDSVYVQIDDGRDAKGANYSVGAVNAFVIERPQNGMNVVHASHPQDQDLKRTWNWTGGLTVEFASGGPKRLRIYLREDGAAFTQFVLSSGKYTSTAPDQDYVSPPPR